MLTDALKQQFGDAPMQQTMSQAFVTFPPGPVAIGASWRVEMSTMGLRAVSEMTLESVEGGVATIVETTTMEPDPDHEPEVGALSFTYDQVDGSAGATYRVDVETGMLLDADLEQEMAATINVSMPGMPEGFASQMPPIPMVMSAVAHVELVKLD